MNTSDKGIKERDTLNHHAVCWALQASEFARLIGDANTRYEIRSRYRTIFVPNRMSHDGSFPKELTRTKPYSYSIFNFDVMVGLCQSLEDRSGQPTGERSLPLLPPRRSTHLQSSSLSLPT